eukprot:6182867-Pleurochrysis_carterae.AAC.3
MNGTGAGIIHRERELMMESIVTFAEHMRDWSGSAPANMGLHLGGIPKVCTTRKQRRNSQGECKDECG